MWIALRVTLASPLAPGPTAKPAPGEEESSQEAPHHFIRLGGLLVTCQSPAGHSLKALNVHTVLQHNYYPRLTNCTYLGLGIDDLIITTMINDRK